MPIDTYIDSNHHLAMELWKHAAMRGNSLAQVALAEELLEISMELLQNEDLESSHDLRLHVVTLFGLVAQQVMMWNIF